MSKQSFLYGTLILVGAGFITKILGFIYRIALSRIIGDEGMGLFQMAFPILIFLIVITTAGIPVAISKLVSEAEAKEEEHKIQAILIVSILVVTITSVTVTISVFFLAPFIANYLLTDERTIYSFLAMSPVIPIIAISSVFRGYFQGRQNMTPFAISQIVEQIIRIFTVLALAKMLLPYGIAIASAGAMIGMVVGEFMGMLYLLYSYRKDPQKPDKPIFTIQRVMFTKQWWIEQKETLQSLARIAGPVTFSRMIGSLSYAVEPIVVAQSLAFAGIATAASTALYGQLEGMALPLVFFPAFITYALTVSLVPAISEAAAQKKTDIVERRLQQAIRLSLLIGAPCTLMVYLMAEPLSLLLYQHPEVGKLIQVMAPFSLFYYLQGPFASVLQGLDKASIAMRNSIIGAVIKIILIFILASRPDLGIIGVAMAINFGIIVVTGLHFFSIAKLVPISIHIRELVKLSLAVGITGMIIYYLMGQEQSPLVTRVLLSMLSGFCVYFMGLMFLGLIKKEDVIRVPYIGPWLSKRLPY
ncbi:stage V sporulation protein B [Risungbinella massiliensis]|uniref:stage V sporulation protein B n=1 Tax=Risungbinella massiliensis TaxID=1329796 RepID=UPI0005CC0713|nr:stage V sporulation protein B [Risungbinella massiliensis]